MNKSDIKKIKMAPKFLKKYNYNINEVIGVKNNEKYILFIDKKLIRIYRKSLKSSSLLSTYIPIEQAIFYSFEIEKSIIEKVDIDNFVETKVYEEAGVDETEKYIIKYKIVDQLKDEKLVSIETIIVPVGYIDNGYKNIIEETGYIDYISFPAFAYRTLYDEKIIKKANDLFVVFLYDKIFLTFYHDGDLLSIVTISGGLEKIYESLSKLKIKNFDINMFEKLLTKKGISSIKYSAAEKAVLDSIKDEFLGIINIVNEQIDKVGLKYNIGDIDRIYVTSEYGNIEGLQEYIQKMIKIDTFGFEFYEEYNLDRLAVNPFLFLGMLEAHYAYKTQIQTFNFSEFLRKPTFLYRPSGRLLLFLLISVFLIGIYPFYLYIQGVIFENKNHVLDTKINTLRIENGKVSKEIAKYEKRKKSLEKESQVLSAKIKKTKNFIKSVYEFKYSYIPKSTELVEITKLMNKNGVYLQKLLYNDNEFILNVFSFKDENIPDLLDDLVKHGFNVSTEGVKLNKQNRYTSIIRIKE